MFEKIKPYLASDQVFYSLLLVLVGASAFGLGRLSMTDLSAVVPQSGAVVLSEVDRAAAPDTPVSGAAALGAVVASEKGSKYHLPWCPGASQMKEENKIWFESIEAAEAAGYAPASNCKGL